MTKRENRRREGDKERETHREGEIDYRENVRETKCEKERDRARSQEKAQHDECLLPQPDPGAEGAVILRWWRCGGGGG